MLEELLNELASQGWLVNNLYQVDVALWRVSLRMPAYDGHYYSDWAEGETLIETLVTCIDKLDQAEFSVDPPQSWGKSVDKPAPPTGQSLLQALGLVKPKVKIARRV